MLFSTPNQSTTAKKYSVLFLILLFSFWIRIFFWSNALPFAEIVTNKNDSITYNNSARALLEAGIFAVSPEKIDIMQTLVPPGYPGYIAGVYLLFGEHPEIVILTHVFLSLLIFSLIYSLANRIFNSNTGLIAVLLASLDVLSFSHAFRMMTETVFTFLLLIMLNAGVIYLKSGRVRWILLAGIALAMATFIRPINYYLIVPVALGFLIWLIINRSHWLVVLSHGALLILPFLIFVGAWQIRNFSALKSSQFSTVGGTNMFEYRAAAVVALRDNISFLQAREQLHQATMEYRNAHPVTAQWTDGQLDNYLMRQGLGVILQHPFLFVQTQISGAIPMLLGGGEGPLLRMLNVPVGQTLDREIFDALSSFDISFFFRRFASGTALIAFIGSIAYLGFIYLGALFWLLQAVIHKRGSVIHLFLWGVMLYFILISAGPEAGSRFRVPIMPILAIYAAQGLVLLVSSTKRRFAHD